MADENETTKPPTDDEQPLQLSTKKKPVPLVIDGEDYELRPMNGDAVGSYRNQLGNRMKFVNGKPAGFSNYKGMESSLITLCLFKVADGKAVAPKVIDGWDHSVIDLLYLKCRKMNGLDDESEDAEKKD